MDVDENDEEYKPLTLKVVNDVSKKSMLYNTTVRYEDTITREQRMLIERTIAHMSKIHGNELRRVIVRSKFTGVSSGEYFWYTRTIELNVCANTNENILRFIIQHEIGHHIWESITDEQCKNWVNGVYELISNNSNRGATTYVDEFMPKSKDAGIPDDVYNETHSEVGAYIVYRQANVNSDIINKHVHSSMYDYVKLYKRIFGDHETVI